MALAISHAQELELIRRARAGDRSAAGQLIRTHQGPLQGYLLRMCGHLQVAEDIAQEAFVRALTHLDRFDGQHRFSTWLFTIARRLLLNELSRRRAATPGDAVLDTIATRPSIVARVGSPQSDEAEREGLRQAMLHLSVEQREAVVLFHQLDWPIAVVAAHMELPIGTVKSHLHRGRQRLREILESMGLADTPSTDVLVSVRTASRSGAGQQHA